MSKKKRTIFSIIIFILIILFAISCCPVEWQNDTFYTIKIGEYIMQNGMSVLQEKMDPFSWHENLPYTYPHWLYNILMYGIFNIGGFTGINIFTAILACILSLSIFYINYKLLKNKATSFIVTIIFTYLMSGFITARAQLLTFIFFIWTVYFIEKFLETKKKKYAIALLIIPIIIANVHSAVWPFYFVLFLPYIAEYIISFIPNIYRFFYKLIKKKDIEQKKNNNLYKIQIVKNPNVKFLIIIAIIALFTGFLTPIGDSPYTYSIKIMQGNTMNHISEHSPLILVSVTDFFIYIVAFLAILIFTNTKIRLKDFFMSFGLLYMALNSIRQMSMFILIGGIIVHRLICALLDKYYPNIDEKLQNAMLKIPGIVIAIGIVIVASLYMIRGNAAKEIVNPYTYPVSAVDYILENVDISTMKIFNEYNYGSYLLFRGIPVFVDSRSDLYTPQFNGSKDIFGDAINTAGITVYYENIFKNYGITHVIVQKNSRLNMLLNNDSNYKLLYSDDGFFFYERLGDNV